MLLFMIIPTLHASGTSLECADLSALWYRSDDSSTKAVPRHRTPKSSAVYSCPMHPEVTSKKRGKCPKCKMDLVRQTAPEPEVSVATNSSKTLNIPDVEVLDQDGNVRHFYTDLIKGKTSP